MWYLNVFYSVAHVIFLKLEITESKQGVSNHKFHSSHAENRSVETGFTHTNVNDDTSENDSDYQLSPHTASQVDSGFSSYNAELIL